MQDFRKLERVAEISLPRASYVRNICQRFQRQNCSDSRRRVRRAAVSIPANIAEGVLSGRQRSLAQFLRIALGSAAELEYYVDSCRAISNSCRI